MKVIDPGHLYELDSYDGEDHQWLMFFKREGSKYPGNVGINPGTNIQDVLRVLIDRVQYLNNQVPCSQNLRVLSALRVSIIFLEERAAERHALPPRDITGTDVENEPYCPQCGHWACKGH